MQNVKYVGAWKNLKRTYIFTCPERANKLTKQAFILPMKKSILCLPLPK